MDSTYSFSSAIGFVSSKRRLHFPLYSSAIEKFKQNSNGRGTFIPLDMRIHSGGSASSGYKNIIDCLECDLENRPFLASIFGETYVVDNISEAMKAFQEKRPPRFSGW